MVSAHPIQLQYYIHYRQPAMLNNYTPIGDHRIAIDSRTATHIVQCCCFQADASHTSGRQLSARSIPCSWQRRRDAGGAEAAGAAGGVVQGFDL